MGLWSQLAVPGHKTSTAWYGLPISKSQKSILQFTENLLWLNKKELQTHEQGYDWNAEKNEAAIAVIKVKLNMIDRLQEKTLYDGQSEYYRNLQ